MLEQQGRRWKLVFAFAVVYIVWGSTYLGIRYAITSIPPLLMAGVRFTIAGMLLLAWAQLRGGFKWPKLIHWRSAAILGLLMLLGGNGGVTLAEKYIPSGMAALLVTTEPLWLVLLSWGKRGGTAPTRLEMAGLLLGLGGVVLLVAPSHAGGTGLLGAVLVLVSAFTWAAGSIYSTTVETPAPMVSNGIIMLCGGAFLALAGLLRGEWQQVHIASITLTSVAALLYLSLFGSIAAFSAYTYLLAHTTPAKASTYAFVNPVVAVLLGWFFAGEPLTTRSLAAMCAIVLAVALLIVKVSRVSILRFLGTYWCSIRKPVRRQTEAQPDAAA
jgi:drug/metabolite transporter (DMT)-like permease